MRRQEVTSTILLTACADIGHGKSNKHQKVRNNDSNLTFISVISNIKQLIMHLPTNNDSAKNNSKK